MGQRRKRTTRKILLAIFGIAFIVVGYFLIQRLLLWRQHAQVLRSAYGFYKAELRFMEDYVLDKSKPDGGFSLWVNQDGTVEDTKKYSIFQANVILWAGGIQSQRPDEKNVLIVKRAADYLTRYLYKQNGEWYEYDDKNHREKSDFFWNPRSENHIAYALFQAYRITGEERYARIAAETTGAMRGKNPGGFIYSDIARENDIGFRFPEHMGQLQDFYMLGNIEARDYVRQYDANYRDRYGKEFYGENELAYYYHGMAVIDKLLYGYLDNNEEAYQEGSAGREYYWSTGHDDEHFFNYSSPGENSDNGRDYYDKRLAMNMIEWTVQNDEVFRDDAIDTWFQIKRFWDFKYPHGFMANLSDKRKTCFTIGMPQMLQDLTPPRVVEYNDERKFFFNHQLTVTVEDPEYFWNDVPLRGIGLNSPTFRLEVPFGFEYGQPEIVEYDGCQGCLTYTTNYFQILPAKVRVHVRDYFDNISDVALKLPTKLAFKQWNNLNANSVWFYSVLAAEIVIALFVYILTMIVVVTHAKGKRHEKVRERVEKKMKKKKNKKKRKSTDEEEIEEKE